MAETSARTSTAGVILSLIAGAGSISRAELVARTGFSRTTVAQHLGALLEEGFVREAPDTMRSGGRPSRMLELETGFGVVLCADIGETHARLAVTDLGPNLLAERRVAVDLRVDPAQLLGDVMAPFRELLDSVGRSPDEIVGIGLGLPAPVDFAAGRVTGPSVMPSWDGYDVAGWFAAQTSVPVLIENDVNLMTLWEWREYWPDEAQLILIKAGTGIGSGIIADGRLYRGANGVAGDIGHVQLLTDDPPRCRCGKLGCLEARAAGWSIARRLRGAGMEAVTSRDVVTIVDEGRPEAAALVRDAGHWIGEAAAAVVSVLNPGVIVIAGNLAHTGELLLSGIRERIFLRSLPIATSGLKIVSAQSDDRAVVMGAARMVIREALQARADQTIAAHTRSGRGRNDGRAPSPCGEPGGLRVHDEQLIGGSSNGLSENALSPST